MNVPAAPMRRALAPTLLATLVASLVAACGGAKDAAPGAAAGAAAGAAPEGADPTRAVAGATGAPAGYTSSGDRPGAPLTDAKYTVGGDGAWEVQTGPAHVTWAAKDTARGAYTVRARFEQLAAPSHPEAYGLIVGGADLDAAGRRYTYFVVRGTGEYLIRVREGDQTRDVQPWTAAPALAKQDASGRATYDLAVRVGADSVRFLVGDTPVHAVAAGSVPTDGIAGIRVNHNLHLKVQPVAITK